MRTLLRGLLVVLLLALAAALLWAFRPWSEHSPFEVYRFSEASDRKPAYRAMETIYPSAPIAASPTPYDFPDAARQLSGEYTVNGRRRTVEDYAAERETTGLIVLHGGEVVLERYFGGETAEDRHTSWSVAKSVIATLVGRALMDGEIDSLDDPAEKYAPEYAGTDYGATSLRHLLAMSSGIDFDEDYEVDGSDIRRLFFGTFMRNKDVDEIVRSHERNRPAGSDFDYISSNTAVLAAVLRGAYDTPVPQLAEEYVFAPLGMNAGSWLTDAPGGKALGYCCLQVTLRDYAKLGQLYLQDGVVGRTRVIPEGWAEYVRTPPSPDHEPGTGTAQSAQGYGAHFWLPADNDGEYAMQGYNGQVVWIDPKRDVVIAMTSADPTWPGDRPEFLAMFRSLAAQAAGRETAG